MEGPDPWTQATRRAGQTAVGATFSTVLLPLGYALTHSPANVKGIAIAGVALLVVASLATIVGMVAGGRRAWVGSAQGVGWLAAAVISLMAQLVLLVVVATVWRQASGGR